MTLARTRKPEEYKAVAGFFRATSASPVVAKWHTDTGFLPVTIAGYEKVKASASTSRTRARTSPISSSPGRSRSENSRGLRLGNMPEIRNIIQEELEKAFQSANRPAGARQTRSSAGTSYLRNFEAGESLLDDHERARRAPVEAPCTGA